MLVILRMHCPTYIHHELDAQNVFIDCVADVFSLAVYQVLRGYLTCRYTYV